MGRLVLRNHCEVNLVCLAIPCRVIELDSTNTWAVVENHGIRRKVGVQLLKHITIGEYVLVHAGYAIEKLDKTEASKQMRLWEELMNSDDI